MVNNVNPTKVNVIFLKDNFSRPTSVREVLDVLEISKHNYYGVFQYQKVKI